MNNSETERPLRAPESCVLDSHGHDAIRSIHESMADMLSGTIKDPRYHLASVDPGTGKTAALCSFLKGWKADNFMPSRGALIVLSTHKEIEDCIARSDLKPCDFAILVKKDHPLNERGLSVADLAPVLFTTQEKLRRLCVGKSFAEVSSLHYRGQPRRLRVWDEAFLPATGETIRKDTLVQPLEALRPVAPQAVGVLESLADSLSAETVGSVVEVPRAARDSYKALYGQFGTGAERWSALDRLAGLPAVVTESNREGLGIAGAALFLPTDFAPALILDASGRVRETYKTMEASGIVKRLPSGTRDYSNLHIHHWDRAASRSALSDPSARQEVLGAAAATINASGGEEPWLIIHLQDKAACRVREELTALVDDPARLSWLHWGNHHGTNAYRQIRKVMVIGLLTLPGPAYSALHVASGGSMALATDKAALGTLKAGEHRHNLLQAICRASVRNGTDGACGECAVYLVGKLGSNAEGLLAETFPGAQVTSWFPAGLDMPASIRRVTLEIEAQLSVPGVRKIGKAAVRAALGYRTTAGLSKVLAGEPFRAWADSKGLEVTTRGFAWREAA